MISATDIVRRRSHEEMILKGSRFHYDQMEYSPRAFDDAPKFNPPSVLYEEDETVIFRVMKSYAKHPGKGIGCVEDELGLTLPVDFADFHANFAEAVIMLRSAPVHLWPTELILEKLADFRYDRSRPLRFVRIADYHLREGAQFALWSPTGTPGTWQIITTSAEYIDDSYDSLTNSESLVVVGTSFTDWICAMDATNGVDDLYCLVLNIPYTFDLI